MLYGLRRPRNQIPSTVDGHSFVMRERNVYLNLRVNIDDSITWK